MAGIWDGIGALLSKVTQWIPGRIEALKNERIKLIDEKSRLLRGIADVKTSKRVGDIDARIAYIDGVLANSAKDS